MKTSSFGRDYAEAWHPGAALEGLMVLNDRDFAWVERKTGVPQADLKSLVRLDVQLDDDMATALGEIFGKNEAYWRNLQITYEREMDRERAREAFEDEVGNLGAFGADEAAAMGWIPPTRDQRDTVKAVREFLSVESLNDFDLFYNGSFRLTGLISQLSPYALAMWLRQGEIEAQKRRVDTFDRDAFKHALAEIRHLTQRSPFAFLPAITDLCASAGVAFIVVECIPQARVKGVTRWREDGTPWIQINLKGNWLDSFWVNFYHEAAHVLQGPREFTVHVEGEPVPGSISEEVIIDEQQATEMATDLLISPREWQNFRIPERPPSAEHVREYAARLGIHPGIIVGRLQQERIVSWSDNRMNRLKSRVTATEREELTALNIGHEPPDAAYLAAA